MAHKPVPPACHILTLQPAGSSMRVLVSDQPPLRAAPAQVPQHPQQLDKHQRDEVGEQMALADTDGVHSPGEGEQQPGQEQVDAVLAAEDLGVFLRVAASRGGQTAGFLHLPATRCGPRFPGEPQARPTAAPGAERDRRPSPCLPPLRGC